MTADENDIRQLVQTWMSATKRGDLDTVLGDWAWMRQQLTVVVTPANGGPESVRAGHTLGIFRKERGRWLLARDANLLASVD